MQMLRPIVDGRKISREEVSCHINKLDQNEFHQHDFTLGVFIF